MEKFNRNIHVKTKDGIISKEDKEYWSNIYNRYLSDTPSTKILARELGISDQILFRLFKKFDFKLVSKEEQAKRNVIIQKNNCLEKYGVESPFQLDSVKQKVRKTNLERHGVEYPMQSKKVRNKSKETCLEKYGADNINKVQWVREKSKNTCMKKYGVEYSLQNKEIRDKGKETNKNKFGVENPNQCKEVRDKIIKTNLERYGTECPLQNEEVKEKGRKTNFKKYGVRYSSMSSLIKEKTKNSNLKKYGVVSTALIEEVRNKMLLTQKNNVNARIIEITEELGYFLEEPFTGSFNYSTKKFLSWKSYKFKHSICGNVFNR